MNPIVSVVIPTANRPHYLPRAVDSALAGMKPGDVEVIVVPNGPDESWRKAMLPYQGKPYVRVVRIAEANANKARNAGLAEAKGEFVRFLDDDDYLFSESACKQCWCIKDAGADVISGKVLNIDYNQTSLGVIKFPETNDFVCACTSNSFALPTSHVFNKKALFGLEWAPHVPRAQDYIWMLSLAGVRDWHWLKFDQTVGVWFQHPDLRTTTVKPSNKTHQNIALALFDLLERLRDNGRLNEERFEYIIRALWYRIHTGFPLDPIYWHKIGKRTLKIDPYSSPDVSIFTSRLGRLFGALLIEWIFLPKRIANHWARELRGRFIGWDYRRIL